MSLSEDEKRKYRRDPAYGRPPNWDRGYGKHFPNNTDACSRHVRIIADEILRDPKSPVRRMLIDAGYEPDHWAQSMEYTVLALWRNRAERQAQSVGGEHRSKAQ